MWDAFLDRTCYSCVGLRNSSSSFCKRKTDLFSVEYSTYIRKDIINRLRSPMKTPNQNQSPKKGTPRTNNSYYEKYKNEQKAKTKQAPVYFKANAAALKDTRPAYPPKCNKGEKCTCPKHLGKAPETAEKPVKEKPHHYNDHFQAFGAEAVGKKCKVSLSDIVDTSKGGNLGGITDRVKKQKDQQRKKKQRDNKPVKPVKPVKPTPVPAPPPQPPPPPPPAPTPPAPAPTPPVLKLKNDKEKKKKGLVREDRTDSTPLYKTLLSKLDMERWRVYKFGEKGSGTVAKTDQSPQDFYILRDECLLKGMLFEDLEFPAVDASLYIREKPEDVPQYLWKRPNEIVRNPQLFVEGFSRFDVQQGDLGNCWMVSAVAVLTMYPALFTQVVPEDQGFDEENYAGIFHFRFWQFGRWIDVVVDDKLPTYDGKLVYLHSSEVNEFWSALLEKAYSKLFGSYEALKGGSPMDATQDLTGGVTETYTLSSSPDNLFQIMLKAFERCSLIAGAITADPEEFEAVTPEGLVKGHAYSVTKVQYVDIKTPNVSGKIPLLRIRNPWGNETEWNGAWSDGAPEWRYISDYDKDELGLVFENDGEFWMSFEDFKKHFTFVEICNLNPDSLTGDELVDKKKWEVSVFEGEWVRGVTAGGCRNYLETFWRNPQYRVTLTQADDDDKDGCTIVVAVMQKNRRLKRTGEIEDNNLVIGLVIYHLAHPDRGPKPLDVNFFRYNGSAARSPTFCNLRELCCRFKLPPGTYCIVPSTFKPNEEGEFLLRVFTEHQNIMEENDEKIGYGELDAKVSKEPTPEELEDSNKVYDTFKALVGEDGEVDWRELKEILDTAMKAELQQSDRSVPVHKTTVKGVDAAPQGAPQQQTQIQSGDGGFITALLGLICGALCKDNPLMEIIPPPTQTTALNARFFELQVSQFSKDICRSMVAMLDADRSGKLNYVEFVKLWTSLRKWKNAWLLHDADRSGTFSGFELRDALNAAGYRLNNRILNILMHRYGNKQGEISFDDFMMCAIKLKTMIDIFLEKDQTNVNTATFTMEEWLECTLYS